MEDINVLFFFYFFTQCHAYTHIVSEVKIVNCTEGNVRLVDGPSANKGRLEVCIDKKWATVCNSAFGLEESRAACAQLGYQKYGE